MTDDERMAAAWRAGNQAEQDVDGPDDEPIAELLERAYAIAMRAALSYLAATPPYEALREQVARALCRAHGHDPDEMDTTGEMALWETEWVEAGHALAVLLPALEALRAERDEALRRRDEWRKKAEGFDAVRNALREKIGAPWPPNLSRALWAGLAADQKKRADDAEAERDAARAEVARLREALVIFWANGPKRLQCPSMECDPNPEEEAELAAIREIGAALATEARDAE